MFSKILMNSIFAVGLSLFMTLPIWSQDIAAFSGTKTPTTATVPNVTAEPLSRGPGLTASSGPTFSSGNWATGKKIDLSDYIEWSVTAAPGYIINITELQINFDRDPDGFSNFFTGNGPAKIRIRTSLDHFKSDIYAHDKVSNSGQSPTIGTALRSAPGDTITFRLYGFAANIGMLGPLGTLDIEGGLGKVLGLEDTGIRLAGTITYDGLQYKDNVWTPYAPNAQTENKNAIIYNGTYTETRPVKLKNLKVNPEARIVIKKSGAITVNGDLITANNVTLHSGSDNYSSLIVTGEVTGTITYQRQLQTQAELGGSGNALLVSSPVAGESYDDFKAKNPAIFSDVKNSPFQFGPFDKTKADFKAYSSKDKTSLSLASGYKVETVKESNVTFDGTVTTGEIIKEIFHSGPKLKEWNLIGNPYPSYLKVSDFLSANSTQFAPASSGIYTFDGDPSLGWKVYNRAYLTLHPDKKILPGQGFMVSSNIIGGNILFTPGMRTTGKSSTFKVNTPRISSKVGYLKLKMTNGHYTYATEFYFNEQSSNGLDPGYDAGVYGGKAPECAIYSHLLENGTGLDLAVQSLSYNDLSENMSIPLGINAPENQNLTVSISDILLPPEIDVYLEDRMKGSFTLLNLDDFKLTADSNLSDPDRFVLHIVNSTVSYGSNDINGLQLFTSNGGHSLHINGNVLPDTVVNLYDLQGQLLIHRFLDPEINNHTLDLSPLKPGLYLVKLRSGMLEKIRSVKIR